MWEWDVDVGERVRMDGKGRVTIPASIKGVLNQRVFEVELAGSDSIVLRAVRERDELIAKIKALRLRGDRKRRHIDASAAKDAYGGVKI